MHIASAIFLALTHTSAQAQEAGKLCPSLKQDLAHEAFEPAQDVASETQPLPPLPFLITISRRLNSMSFIRKRNTSSNRIPAP
jgi:hypothetical protein